jgi:ABC-2 type transport system permease protein
MSARRVAVVVRHELRVASRDPLPLMVLIVFPVVTMAFLKPAFRPALAAAGHPGANGAEQVVPGQAVLSAFFVVTLVTWAFFSEHGWGTWDRLRASPATSFEIVVGKGMPRVAMGVAQLVVVMAAGVVLFDLHIRGDTLALVPLAVVFPLSLVVLGVAVTAVFRTAQQAQAFGIVGMVMFGAIGGALVPFNVLPGWAQSIAPATPTYWAMRVDGRSFGSVALPVAVLSAMTLGCTAIALARLRLDETKVAWS